MKCPYCNRITEAEVLNEEIIDDRAVITIRYICQKCHKEFIGTVKSEEIKFWYPEEIEELDYYLG